MAARPEVVRTPALHNGHVRLRPLAVEDLDWLRAVETGEFLAFRWRLHGGHPSPHDFVDQLWHGLLVMFVVERVSDGSVVGVLSAYHADHRNGLCRVGGARLVRNDSLDTAFLAGLAMLFDYLFDGWPFRKLYLETPEFNLPQFASAVERGVLVVEARLTEAVFLVDRYWDALFLSVSREMWLTMRSSVLGRYLLKTKSQ
jgi:hypothetical protein